MVLIHHYLENLDVMHLVIFHPWEFRHVDPALRIAIMNQMHLYNLLESAVFHFCYFITVLPNV